MSGGGLVYGTAAACALALVGYLIYFDQKRQRDPEFRQRLKQKRQSNLSKTNNNSSTSSFGGSFMNGQQRNVEDIAATLEDLDKEPVPQTQQGREQYFVKQLSLAEELMGKGPQFFEVAAKCLLRVVKIYPDPMQLLMILEQSTPQPVFALLMDLLAVEMKNNPAGTEQQTESKIEDIDE